MSDRAKVVHAEMTTVPELVGEADVLVRVRIIIKRKDLDKLASRPTGFEQCFRVVPSSRAAGSGLALLDKGEFSDRSLPNE